MPHTSFWSPAGCTYKLQAHSAWLSLPMYSTSQCDRSDLTGF